MTWKKLKKMKKQKKKREKKRRWKRKVVEREGGAEAEGG